MKFENIFGKLMPTKKGPEKFLKKETEEGPVYETHSFKERQQLDKRISEKIANEAKKEAWEEA